MARNVRESGREVEMRGRDRGDALRASLAHLQARRFAEALASVRPWADDPQGGLLYALALAGSGEAEGAAPLLARIARANPAANHPLQDLLGLLPPGALLSHLRAGLRHAPDDPRLLALLGTELAASGPMEDALAAFRRVTELRPGDAGGWSNLGKALSAEGRFAEAETAFAAALCLAPGDARIAYNRAVMLLKAGRLAEGWAALRARHALPRRPPPLPGPRLLTLEVAGRTVVLAHDEGFGDTLQFIRYALPLAERGARVIALMPAPLARLIQTVPGVAEVVTGPALPRYDAWSPLLDVPALFGDWIPGSVPYLRAETPGPALPSGRKIGLVWSGDPAGLLDRDRSMPVEALDPLRAVPGVTWVSLQKDATPPGWMVNPMPAVRDFADTAAIVAQLDAVVSVDTAVAHLAGGLGKPVLLMDRYDNCWRWLHGREDSPWYPGLRLFRQTAPGDWAGVVRAVKADLTPA